MQERTPTTAAAPAAEPQAPARATVGRNALLLTGATIAARLATFALAIAMGRALGAESYGLYGLASAIATVVVPVADLGLTPYVVREVARLGGSSRDLVRRCAAVKALTSLGTLALAGLAVLALRPDGELAAALLLVLAATLADGVAQFVFGFFQGRERMGFEAAATTATSLARSAGGIALVVALGELEPVLVWIAATSLAQMALTALRLRRALREAAPAAVSPPPRGIAWGSVTAMGLVTIFAMVYLRADSILIGAISGEEEVGWYTAAYTLMAALQIVPWMLAVALAPVFARTHAGDRAAFARAWERGVRAVALLALPLALVTSLLATPIVERLYGAGFGAGGSALAILAWSTPVWALNMVVSGALRGAHRERWLTVVTGGGALLNVALNVWAIDAFGIDGAAAVTVATEGAVLVALAALALRAGIVAPPRLPLARIAVALAVAAAVAVAGRDLEVLVVAPAAALAYAAALAAMRVLGADELAAIRGAMARR
ncbi:MAG TPA: flippase [Capillimicrobium sp.]|nr:flippase [Capillimicrobium sp.]